MSAKWRALQHRHRYTYSSVVFPKSFIETLDLIPSEISSSFEFFSQLNELTSLNSTYSQISAVKSLSSSFARLLSAQEVTADIVYIASKLYLEILFLENSLPLHRTLISPLTKNRKFLPLISGCFESLCEEYGDLNRKGKKRFMVSRAALSLVGFPKLGFLTETLEKCSVLVANDVSFGLTGVISDIECGSRPSPVVMEQCQEAMSCLYYLLQRYPTKFVGLKCGGNALESVVGTILTVLKSSAVSRDCLVASGVSFCAAIQACMSHEELSSFISRGFFGVCDGDGEVGDVGMKKVMPNGDLYSEIRDFSVLSRLCILRGILTAIPRTVLNTSFVDPSNGCVWTILYNGILPELCKYCENPADSHFNFHALTVTQICLQQIKTSILATLTDFSGNYYPLTEDMLSQILKIIWNNLDDPLSQTVKQVHLIFDLLLDIEASLPLGEDSERTKSFMFMIVADLLRLGPRCKGRYVPLASVTKQLGAKSVLDLNPTLLSETVYAYVDDDVCCAVTSFLKCFLECLRDECWSHDGVEKGYDAFRGLCLPPILHGLVSGHSKLRSNLNTYALPAVLEVDSDSIFQMLAFISVGPSTEENKLTADLKIDQCVAALVSVLKVSRMLALLEGDINLDNDSSVQLKSSDQAALICVKGINFRVPIEWFILALMHADESLRIDAAESLFLNPKTASLPSSLELSLLREAVPLNMRCCSTAFQMKWTSLFRKFFSRVRTALERQVKQGSWQPIASIDNNGVSNGRSVMNEVIHRAEDLFHFMKWLSCFLLYSCYPSAPYERKTMAMELILIMVDVWPTSVTQRKHLLYPYSEGFTSPESTLCLVGSIIDSWDRLRENSFRILSSFPTPLPGISSHNSVKEVITWAKKLVCSPRVRESDAGALVFRLIFRKYVLELQWVVGVSDNFPNSQSKSINGELQMIKSRSPVVEYISSLIEWLQNVVEQGEKDLSEACRNSFVHGVLLTLRYTFGELDWNSEVVLSSNSEMRCILEKLLQLVMRVTSLALWVVSADALSIPCEMDDGADDGVFLTDEPLEMPAPESLAEPVDTNLKEDDEMPAEQAIMVGCWLAMKEISLLLGTIIRKIPLPSSILPDSSESCTFDGKEITVEPDSMLDLQQLETIGNHFLQVLLKMKHNGAIDKTRAGFTALCNRLLCSNDRRLCKMTESWMEHLMERTVAKGQTVDDLLRRSAGIPAAFIALFLSEPDGMPKKLLPKALRWLIDVVKMSLLNAREGGNHESEVLRNNSINDQPLETSMQEMQANVGISKIRDEGVIPTVHAFNVLKTAFNDTNLATDTSGFCAEALIIAIRSFSSPYWEVRNSACLAYTALVRRMIGFLNVQKREAARRALTGFEFFHRYPALHPFLFSELKIATELLNDGSSRHAESNIAKAIHPSLYPILILLSRLKPSLISSGTDDVLDPFILMPFIRRCATQSNLRVRVLASRALVGLVSNEKLHDVLSCVAHGLPPGRSPKSVNMSNSDGAAATQSLSFNSIHGILLQLSSLLDNNCRNLTDINKKYQIVGELISILSNCLWIGRTRSCPCPTLNCSYLRVLDQMLGIARTLAVSHHVTPIQNLLLELASECLDTQGLYGMALHDPTRVELRRQAAASYFGCLFAENLEAHNEEFQVPYSAPAPSNLSKMTENGTSASVLHARIVSCISDATYEVRVAALKKLFQLVKSMKCHDDGGAISMWAETYLQSMMMSQLATEENPKCIYYILKIIFSWHVMRFETMDAEVDLEPVLSFWKRLVHLNSTMMRSKTREILICCMAISVKQSVLLLQRSTFISSPEIKGDIADKKGLVEALSCIGSFVVLVKQHSLPSEPVNMRKAAAEAIVASGLLQEATSIAPLVSNDPSKAPQIVKIEEIESSKLDLPVVVNFYAGRILDLWFTCIQLLEDEDFELRQKLANNVQKYVDSKRSKGSQCTDTVPSQVDRVIQSSFVFLSAIFGHWIEYLNYLCGYVINAAGSVTSHRDLVRRIFDKEIDNHHEEMLLICQICCSHLEKLLVPEDSARRSFKIFLQTWRLRFLRQLKTFANSCVESVRAADWIGGIGNHKDAFTSLYANLLGIYALTQNHPQSQLQLSDIDNKVYLSEFAELRGVIRPFLRNPLISNLYFLLIQSHEKMIGVSLTAEEYGDCLVWDGFDPYFLLR